MESFLLVERLKRAIQDDFKDMREELDKVKQEKEQLADKNDTLYKLNKELKDDNISLTKTLKELKEKYDHLLGKLKRRQDEIKKKDEWWDRYRYTAETMIKKLRTQGSFSPEVLHEVSRDLVDIMEEASSKESSSTHSSQESEVKNPSKLTTSKDGKKKVRYTEVSPENIGTNHPGRGTQSKEFITRPKHDTKPNGDDDSCTKKQDNVVPAAYPGDRVKTTGRKTEKENKNMMGSKKQCTEGIACLWSKKAGKNKENNEQNNLGLRNATKKGYEDDGNERNDEETCGYLSLLTSTPMFSTSNKKPISSDLAFPDISIIHKDGEHLKSPNDMDDLLVAGAEPDDVDSSSPLTPAVPTIFENLLTRRSSLISNSSVTTKTKNDEENTISKDENLRHFKKERKQPSSKELKIVISDIQKLKPTDKDNGTSPSILRNIEFGENDTIDYPVASEDNPGSPSILAVDVGPVHEEEMKSLNVLSKRGLNGIKRKRESFEEKGMEIPEDDKKERPTRPDKKTPINISKENTFKMPTKPLHSTKTNNLFKEADILDPESSSIVLLTDDEDANKMETSSVDMFATSGKSLSKDLSNDRDVIDLREDEGQSSKTADPSTSRFSIKNQDLIKQAEVENDLLDEEFPGFRKPDELNYKNIAVVRKKDERLKLSGFSCRDCELYYGEMTEAERKKKLKNCSRHRAKYSPPPSTPPGFWNLSFPSTQEVIEGGMMVTGDKVPAQKPRRPRKKRNLLKSIPKQA